MPFYIIKLCIGALGRNPDLVCIRLSSAISQMSSKIPQDTEQGDKIVQYTRFIIDELKNILFLDPEPAAMRGYARVNDTELKVNASNLSAVLYKLCKDQEKKAILLEAMRQLPENEISDLSFSEGPLNDVILFLNEVHGKRIIKTGNHIAQNGDGRQKRECAQRFVKCIIKTVEGQAPWSYYGEQMTKEDLRGMCEQFCDYAMRGDGFGDLSIIRAYQRYKDQTPAISRIRIWSLAKHLQAYDEVLLIKSRRNK